MNKKPICIEKTAYKTPVLKTLTVKVEGIICGSDRDSTADYGYEDNDLGSI
ncbi:MAG: hypothetical protein MJZ04_03335 [Bacteroidales bacterium]|nr:hypothetical protein [Bacteroidales bacterium]